jgi:hypothetical protein
MSPSTERVVKKRNREVHFADRIGIKEYNIIPGDNPACTSGTPVQLGWEIELATERNFNFYEHFRSSERLRGRALKIPSIERKQLLIEAGYSSDDCFAAEKGVKVDRKLRLESLKNDGWDRLSLLLLNQTGGLSARGILHRQQVTSVDDATPRLDRFRKSFSLRRERSININTDEAPRSFSVRGGERSIALRAEDEEEIQDTTNGNTDDRPKNKSLRSLSFRRERSMDLFSPVKRGKNLLQATGESLRQVVVQLGSPATKNARSA